MAPLRFSPAREPGVKKRKLGASALTQLYLELSKDISNDTSEVSRCTDLGTMASAGCTAKADGRAGAGPATPGQTCGASGGAARSLARSGARCAGSFSTPSPSSRGTATRSSSRSATTQEGKKKPAPAALYPPFQMLKTGR